MQQKLNKKKPIFSSGNSNKPFAFISYSRSDSKRVYPEIKRLQKKGYRIWYDDVIDPGEAWSDKIGKMIIDCDLFIVFLSTSATNSKFIQNEIDLAGRRNKKILPIYIEETDLTANMEIYLGGLQAIKMHLLPFKRYCCKLDASLAELRCSTTISANREKSRKQQNCIKLLFTIFTGTAISFSLFQINFLDYFTIDSKFENHIIQSSRLLTIHNTSNDVVLISIKEEQFDKFFRGNFSHLINGLSTARAKVIVFDMFFEGNSPDDDSFVNAIINARKAGTEVIVGFRKFKDNQPVIFNKLKDAVSGFGTLCVGEILDNVIKSNISIIRNDSATVCSIDLKAIELFTEKKIDHIDLKKKKILLGGDNVKDPLIIHFSDTEKVKQTHKHCPSIQEDDLLINIYIDFSLRNSGKSHKTKIFFNDAIKKIETKDTQQFKDKIVLIGVQNKSDIFTINSTENIYGVDLHANILNTLLQRTYIHQAPFFLYILIIIILASLGAILGLKLIRLTPILKSALLITAILICIVLPIFLFSSLNLILNMSYPISSFFICYWIAILSNQLGINYEQNI